MTRIVKFVAVVLATSLLAAPLWAAGSCLVQSLATRHCVPDCPMMMTRTQSESQIMGGGTPGDHSCCQISSAPSVPPNSAFYNQNQGWAQVSRVASVVVALNPPAVDTTDFPEAAPPPSTSSYQALLCVFLV